MAQAILFEFHPGQVRKATIFKEVDLSRIPCKGEKIVLDDADGIGYVYDVADVHFGNHQKVDIYAYRVGTITEYNKRLFGAIE